MTDEEKIRAYLATKGARKVPEGTGHMTKRDWYEAERAGERYRSKAAAESPEQEQDRLWKERHYVTDHLGREHVRNGLGEWLS